MFKFFLIRLIFPILLIFTANISYATYTITPPDVLNFTAVTRGSGLQPEVTITNTGANALQVGDIASSNTVDAPFRVIDTGCANSFIQPGDYCSFVVSFETKIEVLDNPDTQNNEYVAATDLGLHEDDFNIEIVNDGDGNSASHVILLSGDVLEESPEPDILLAFSSVNFGNVDVLEASNDPYYFPPLDSPFYFLLINNGTLELDVSSVTVDGSSDITVLGDCVGVIAPSTRCDFLVEFKPLTIGDKTATISIVSNDPDESTFVIPVRGTATGESDGIDAFIEDAGPNNGDGNFDDIPDSQQSYVATFPDSSSNYVTYRVASNQRVNNLAVLPETDFPELPVAMASGVVDFSIDEIAPGEQLEVGVILPVSVNPGGFYIYAPTVDNVDPHWFSFDPDTETGVIDRGTVTFTASTGSFTRNVLSLIVKDGGRGDADMTVNGVIEITGAVTVKQSSSSGGGPINLWVLLCLVSMLTITRCYPRV
ncbi:choice-of-anchor D domain-containing protein [Pseudomonadota bacterium]